jgi:23S rRNA (pseudouridine1915-N3)-methyltransferase
MLACQIIIVGKHKDAAANALADEYRKRLHAKITETTLNASLLPQAVQRQEKEAQAIRQAVLSGHRLIILDERGQNVTSPDLASRVQSWTQEGLNLTFVIGGADGVHDSLRQEAHYLLSFGKLTWPHRLVRVMLYEQLYRAQQINAGHPYHRE